jgi:hypothetical protein
MLARDFVTAAPNRAGAGDITDVRCAEGWCYVAVLGSQRSSAGYLSPIEHEQLAHAV